MEENPVLQDTLSFCYETKKTRTDDGEDRAGPSIPPLLHERDDDGVPVRGLSFFLIQEW